MACNSYQTYHSKSRCGSCCPHWDSNSIYFPDFVANSCCNPSCDSADNSDHSFGCSICDGGGYGSSWGGSCDRGCSCGSGNGCGGWGNGCSCHHGGCGNGWPWFWEHRCCPFCPCGCRDFWDCRHGICPRA